MFCLKNIQISWSSIILTLIWHSTLFVSAVRYPNEIVEPPVVSCEPDQILIKVKTSLTNPSRIYVEDLSGDEQCRTENLNHIGIPLGKCGMQLKKSDSPSGISYRVCFTVQLHPFFATERDASYCAQCNYMETREEVIDTYLQDLSVSNAPPSNLTAQTGRYQKQLKCKYEIRRGSVDGPPVHYAVLGEVVYHTWQCNDDDTGLLVQNCYVENGDGTRILVIDNNGCGVDQYILPTPVYSPDLHRASQETRVFKFADQTVTKFTCQIRLCKKSNGDCDSITPPQNCPPIDDASDIVKMLSDTSANTTNATNSTEISSENVDLDDVKLDKKSNKTSRRMRRHHKNDPKSSLLSPNPDIYPQMDVVGMLTVLDSPDDVEFFEKKSADDVLKRCLSQPFVVTMLTVVALLLLSHIIALLLWIFRRRLQQQRSKQQSFNYQY